MPERRRSSASTPSDWLRDVSRADRRPSCRPAATRSSRRSTRRCRRSAQQQIHSRVPATLADDRGAAGRRPADRRRAGDGDQQALRRRAAGRRPSSRSSPAPRASGASTYKLFPLLDRAADRRAERLAAEHRPATAATYKPKNCVTAAAPSSNGDANVNYNADRDAATATAKSSNTYFVGAGRPAVRLRPAADRRHGPELGMNGLRRSPSDIAQADRRAGRSSANQRAQQLVARLRSRPARWSSPAPTPRSPTAAGSTRRRRSCRSRTATAAPIAGEAHAAACRSIAPRSRRRPSRSSPATPSRPRHVGQPVPRAGTTQRGSKVAGKTGTDAAERRQNKNAALWFVGMTPNLVAASALINFDHVQRPVVGPARREATGQAYGDYAAKVWLERAAPAAGAPALDLARPAQRRRQPGAERRRPEPDRRRRRSSPTAGYKMVAARRRRQPAVPERAPTPSTIAYYGPQRRRPGSTITVCPSSGVGQTWSSPPPPPAGKTSRRRRRGSTGADAHRPRRAPSLGDAATATATRTAADGH